MELFNGKSSSAVSNIHRIVCDARRAKIFIMRIIELEFLPQILIFLYLKYIFSKFTNMDNKNSYG